MTLTIIEMIIKLVLTGILLLMAIVLLAIVRISLIAASKEKEEADHGEEE